LTCPRIKENAEALIVASKETGLEVNADKTKYEGRTKSHEQLFFACKSGTADEGMYGGRWNQLLCCP